MYDVLCEMNMLGDRGTQLSIDAHCWLLIYFILFSKQGADPESSKRALALLPAQNF